MGLSNFEKLSASKNLLMAFAGVLHLRIRKRKANRWLRRSRVGLRRLAKVSESVAKIRQPLARRSIPPTNSVEYNPIVIRAARLFSLAFVPSWGHGSHSGQKFGGADYNKLRIARFLMVSFLAATA